MLRSFLTLAFLAVACHSAVLAQCPPDKLFDAGIGIAGSTGRMKSADFNGDGVLDFVYSFYDCAVADFNGDGILDIVTSSGASVRLGVASQGRGTGNFTPSKYIGAGYSGGVSDSVAIMRGNGQNGTGDGTFAPPLRFATVRYPGAVAANDVDSDGVLDLVIARSSPTSGDSILFSVMLGNESSGGWDGTFAAPVSYKTGSGPGYGNHLLLEDFDRDGLIDVVSDTYGRCHLWSGRPGGVLENRSFLEVPWLYSYDGVTVSDLDGDGYADLLFARVEGSVPDLAIAYNRGTGPLAPGLFEPLLEFSWPNDYPNSARGVVAADVTQDGLVDVIATGGFRFFPDLGTSQNSVAVLVGVGPRAFVGPHFYSAFATDLSQILVGDFREDGILDLLTGSNPVLFVGRCPSRAAAAPHVHSVRDVPNDQGGWVSVRWLPSPYDTFDARLVTGYAVWRRLPLDAALSRARPVSNDAIWASDSPGPAVRLVRDPREQNASYWEEVGRVPAHFLEGYGFTAPTTQDSLPFENPYTAFFVSALTEDPFLFFDSGVDSGYSVDNLAPSLPKGVRGFLVIESGDLIVHWHPNPEPDIHHYNVYRGYDPSFEASPANLIASTPDTMYIDVDFGASTFYRVSAVDLHGNESRPPVSVGFDELGELRTDLQQPIDRGGPVEIRFSLGQRTMVRLEVFDVSGRRARSIVDGLRDAGPYSIRWDRLDDGGARVARGLYFIRMNAGVKNVTKKLVLVTE